MKLFLLALLLSAMAARANIVEDDADRLVFDVTWGAGVNGWTAFGVDSAGGNGSHISNLGNEQSRNRYRFLVEIRRVINGVALPVTAGQISFRTDPEDFSPLPDTVLGSPWLSLQPSDHVLALEGNPHGARIVIGLPFAVPDSGSTFGLLVLGLAGLGISRLNLFHQKG